MTVTPPPTPATVPSPPGRVAVETPVEPAAGSPLAAAGSGARPAHHNITTTWLGLTIPGPWADDALCAQTDPDTFFPDKGEPTRDAKATCSRCLVRAECLDYALATGERFGVWGGLSERERRRLATLPTPNDDEDVA